MSKPAIEPALQGMADGNLPPYIHHLDGSIDPVNIQYLQMKGAFILPESELRDQLLRSYITTVHPLFPVLDLKPFLDALDERNSKSGVSLLLFNAVLSSGIPFVKLQSLESQGYKDHYSARRAFYSRIKVLLALNTERDITVRA